MAVNPRLSITGLPALPTACSSAKFCMLRVPTWSMSAHSATSATSRASTTSVTTGRPVSSRTSARIRSPFSPSPWKAYGLVRGLKAPPRSSVAPAACAIRAAASVWSGVSTAHGPAMGVKVPGPIGTPPTSTVVEDGWFSRLTSLYGLLTRTTSTTPGIARRFSPPKATTSPTRPTIVRCTPRLTNADPPACSTRSTTASTCSGGAPGRMTTTMRVSRDDESPGHSARGSWERVACV